MSEKLHQVLEAIVPHVGEGSRVFVLEGGHYHKFRVQDGRLAHTETHSAAHVEKGRGSLAFPGSERERGSGGMTKRSGTGSPKGAGADPVRR